LHILRFLLDEASKEDLKKADCAGVPSTENLSREIFTARELKTGQDTLSLVSEKDI
jgi:hypothetical protein